MVNGHDMDDPMNKYTHEEKRQMSEEEFYALLEAHNRYIETRRGLLFEDKEKEFSSIEEALEYYNAVPFDEAMKYLNSLFEDYDCL